MDMRGLAHFIQDIRKATSNRDEERRRVEEELAKIRSKFKSSDKLTMYDRKKYLCKLMFVLMLGYRVDFGHMEGIRLLAVNEASEKLIGYLSLTVFLNEGHELVMLTTHVVHLDLLSTVDLRVSLALTAISNIGNADFVEPMAEGIRQLIQQKGRGDTIGSAASMGAKASSEESVSKAMTVGSGTGANPQIKKKALLAYLHTWRKNRQCADVSEVLPIAADLINAPNYGLAMAAVSFIEGVIPEKAQNPQWFAKVPGNLVRLLGKIILEKLTEPEYVYYGVPAPWLQAKALRLLQSFPPFTAEQPQLLTQLHTIVSKMIKATERVVKEAQSLQRQRGTANRSNAMNAALIELVSLVVLHNMGSKLLTEVADVVTLYLNDKKDANMRYLGLQLLSRLSFASDVQGFAFSNVFHQAQPGILVALHDPSDSSLKRQALSLLYTTCDASNAVTVVADLLAYLPSTKRDAFREELVLTIASLTERYMTDPLWFVDTMMNVVWHGGDDVSRDVWGRVFHIVLNHPSVQKRAAETALTQLKNWGSGSTSYLGHSSSSAVVVRLAVLLLGEYGYQIGLNVDSAPIDQLNAVASKLPFVDRETKAMILTTFVKFYNLFDSAAVRERLLKTLEVYTTSLDTELQQRALEYLSLIRSTSDETLQAVLEPLPVMELSGSVLPRRQNAQAAQDNTESDVWAQRQREREERGAPKPVHTDPQPTTAAAAEPTPAQDTTSSTPPPPTMTKNDLDKLFSFDDTPIATPSLSQALEAKNTALYRALCSSATKEGTLYEDEHVKLECSQEVRNADARLTLTLSNRSKNGAPLKYVGMRLATTSGSLLVQARGTTECDALTPSEPMRLQVAARCLDPFEEPAAYRLQYTPSEVGAAPRQMVISLPLLPLTFMAPLNDANVTSADSLIAQAKALHSPFVMSSSSALSQQQLQQWFLQYLRAATVVRGSSLVALSSLCTNPSGELAYLSCVVEAAPSADGKWSLSVYCTHLNLQSAIGKCMERLQIFASDVEKQTANISSFPL